MAVVAIDNEKATDIAVQSLQENYPDLKVVARAVDFDHCERLAKTGCEAMVPYVPEDSMLLSLPFGGKVLTALGRKDNERDAVLEEYRRKALGLTPLCDEDDEECVIPDDDDEDLA